MKKPDGFEVMAQNYWDGMVQRVEPGDIVYFRKEDCVKLLRQQHRKFRRMVQRSALTFGDLGLSRAMKDDILAELDRMAGKEPR